MSGSSMLHESRSGSALRLGFRKVLAQRLVELEQSGDDAAGQYSAKETAAFEKGYRAAMQDVLVMVGAGFLTVCMSPALYQKVRDKVRPFVVRHVELGRPWVIWIQQVRHPMLDRIHLIAANSCGILFYITALPLLFWAGELQLARQLTSFMATCIYVGNAVKDAVSAPRPDWNKGVRLVSDGGSDGASTDDMEYGLPSTHTLNTLCMWLYIFYFYSSSTSHGDGFSVYVDTLRSFDMQLRLLVILAWCLFIMHGRLYLGMHSPIDVAAGVCLAMVLLHLYAAVDDFVDAWMTATTAFVPAYQLLFATLLCWTYPAGLQKTPSYNYAVYFTGVCLGVVTGVWRCPHHHSAAAAEYIKEARGPVGSAAFLLFVGRRFVIGLPLALLLRAVSKEILKLAVPLAFRLAGIPCAEPETKQTADSQKIAKGYDVLTPVRLLNYAVVGWTVVEPCFDLFEWLQI